jgi:hypothetical protein
MEASDIVQRLGSTDPKPTKEVQLRPLAPLDQRAERKPHLIYSQERPLR